jgi:haloacetate dehalogenase
MDREHGMAAVNGIRVHYVREGAGPPVVLLHGWPQTWFCWRLLMPLLAERFTLIAPDLRGYGLSDKPAGGFDKRTMAADVRALVHELGYERVALVGHDRGARVAHRYALDHPDEVERLAVLDIIPTRAMFARIDEHLARGFWHWLFHLQPDLPELLVGGNIEVYLRWFFERWTHNRPPVEAAVPEYADDASAAAGAKLTMPVLALWGATGLTGKLPVVDIWREYASDVDGEAIKECGHFLPEEQPAAVADRLLRFLAPA